MLERPSSTGAWCRQDTLACMADAWAVLRQAYSAKLTKAFAYITGERFCHWTSCHAPLMRWAGANIGAFGSTAQHCQIRDVLVATDG